MKTVLLNLNLSLWRLTQVVAVLLLMNIPTLHASESYNAKIDIDVKLEPKPVNPYLLGSNTQWVDYGDGILNRKTLKPDPDIIEKAKQMGVSVLRYPGGSLADLYHWQDGVGKLSSRGVNKRFHGPGEDKVLFGLAEFLYVCKKIGAEPLITVNLITGTPEEAAKWVRAVNIDGMTYEGEPLPGVRYWEVGNEPYLIDDNQQALKVMPEVFAERANRYIQQMKAIDSSIQVGIPVRSDKLGGVPATPLPGYNKAVLKGVTENIDFVSSHSAYYPYIYQGKPDYSQVYLAAMTASHQVKKNFEQTRQELSKYRSESDIKIALTEYNSMFTLSGSESDGFIASWMGAMYVADLLMTLSSMDDLLMANHWSLIGNWYFGALGLEGQPRPTYHVLQALNAVWKGNQLPLEIQSPVFHSQRVGFAVSQENVPFLNAVATRHDNKTELLILNKHPLASSSLTLTLDQAIKTVNASSMSVESIYHYDHALAEVVETEVSSTIEGTQTSLVLPPHSLTRLTIH